MTTYIETVVFDETTGTWTAYEGDEAQVEAALDAAALAVDVEDVEETEEMLAALDPAEVDWVD